MLGIVNTGVLVVCVTVFATPNDQSQPMIVPGAVEVLPLNVQFSVLPLFATSQLSLSVGPVMPNRAVAAVGFVTERVAERVEPLYEAVMTAGIAPPTTRVSTMKLKLTVPAGTVTFAGTVTGSPAVKDTSAPPDGAAPLSVSVPTTDSPPTTLVAPRLNETSVTPDAAVTITLRDSLLPLLNLAVTVAVPIAIAVTGNVALEAPAATVTDGGTEITAALLLVIAMLIEPAAGAVRLTTP
jgi:hypothetical protein